MKKEIALQHSRWVSQSAIASFIATAVDGIVFSALFQIFHTSVSSMAFFGAFAGGITHFFLVKFWVFRIHHQRLSKEIILYSSVSFVCFVLQSFGVGWFHTIGISASISWLITKVLVFMMWSYPLQRLLVFPKEKTVATHPNIS